MPSEPGASFRLQELFHRFRKTVSDQAVNPRTSLVMTLPVTVVMPNWIPLAVDLRFIAYSLLTFPLPYKLSFSNEANLRRSPAHRKTYTVTGLLPHRVPGTDPKRSRKWQDRKAFHGLGGC